MINELKLDYDTDLYEIINKINEIIFFMNETEKEKSGNLGETGNAVLADVRELLDGIDNATSHIEDAYGKRRVIEIDKKIDSLIKKVRAHFS